MSGRRELRFHGDEISYRIGIRYVVSLTWIREDAYRVELRYATQLGSGHPLYARSFADEDEAREQARELVSICR